MSTEPTYTELLQQYQKLPDADLMRIAGPRSSDYTENARNAAFAILSTRKASLVAFDILDQSERANYAPPPDSNKSRRNAYGCAVAFFLLLPMTGLSIFLEQTLTPRLTVIALSLIFGGLALSTIAFVALIRTPVGDTPEIDPDHIVFGEIVDDPAEGLLPPEFGSDYGDS